MSFDTCFGSQSWTLGVGSLIEICTHKAAVPFNGAEVKRVAEHKYLSLILDLLLNFAAHLKVKIAKVRKGIGLIKHLRQS